MMTHIPGCAHCHRRTRNTIIISAANTLEHEVTKTAVCYGLKKLGHDFITEAAFNNGSGVADIIDLDTGICYEIVKTEGEASIARKKKTYPLPVEIVRIK